MTIEKRWIAPQLIVLLIFAQVILPTAAASDAVSVSPGKYDYRLGKDFPREDQVKLDYPKSTILTSITGELMFNVTPTTFNYTSSEDSNSIIKSIYIYIPPEFSINNGISSVWTSFTNDYNPSSISLTTASSNDPIAPNWPVLGIFNLNITKSHEEVRRRTFIENSTQYVRVFNVTSPRLSGRYFFKIFVMINGMTYSIGSHNFPTIVVKGALNPAYVSGVVRYGDSWQPNLYGRPLDSTIHPDGTTLLPKGYGGRVYAEGLTAAREIVQAQAYFNSTAGGRYTLYGLAPATYNITVQAAGYHPQKFVDAFSVLPGQSLENLDFYLIEGATVAGTVFSKHGSDRIPWGYAYDTSGREVRKAIRIDITNLDENMIASSPLKLFDAPLLAFRPRDTLDPPATSYYFSIQREVSFDGHIPQDCANYTSGISSGDYYAKAHVSGYIQLEPTVVHISNQTRQSRTVIDLQRSGHLGVTIHFKHREGDKRDAPSIVGGYLYVEVLDKTGIVAGFNISYVPPASTSLTLDVQGIDIWNTLSSEQTKRLAWAYSHDSGFLPGIYVINALFMNQTVDFVALNALMVASPEQRQIYPTTTEPLVSAFSAQTLELTNRETPVYLQLMMVKAWTGGVCGSVTRVSYELVQAGGFNVTLYAVNSQRPPAIRNWPHPGSGIKIDIHNMKGDLIDSLYTTQPSASKSATVSTLGQILWSDGAPSRGRALGLKSGSYMLTVHTAGCLDKPLIATIPVTLGDLTDTHVRLLRSSAIDLTLVFKTENMLFPIDNRLRCVRPINNIDSTPIRVEVFDDYGELVAANTTYAKRELSSIRVSLDGFKGYYGNPRLLWTNFYDTTDGDQKQDSGLDPGTYQVRATVAGYYRTELIPAKIDAGGGSESAVSLIVSLESLGYLYGTITWYNWCGDPLPLSWATITAYNGGKETVYTYSLDGYYEMWLIPGTYDLAVYHPGLKINHLRFRLQVSLGSSISIDFFMN